jgi:threonyl-tRNA synthetase
MEKEGVPGPGKALLLLGCPEVPVQMGIALYLSHRLRKEGWDVTVAGNPSVLHLIRVSDPARHYMERITALDRCMEKLIEGTAKPDLCLVFAHNDAGLSYAATVGSVSSARVVVIIFGRQAEELAKTIEFPCESIVEKAVHNPLALRQKIDKVFGWAALKS